MRKGIDSVAMLETVYRFAQGRGLTVKWSGLCVWATPERRTAKLDKLLAVAGFKWSEKRQAYYSRAKDGADLPSKHYYDDERRAA